MPLNESLGTLPIDWLKAMVIVTNLYASHFGRGFALPWRYLYTHDLSAHFPQESCWRSVASSNNRQGQTKNTEGWQHTRRTAEALTFADQLRPDGTVNRAAQHQDRDGDFNVKGVSVLTRMLTTIEHLSLLAYRLTQTETDIMCILQSCSCHLTWPFFSESTAHWSAWNWTGTSDASYKIWSTMLFCFTTKETSWVFVFLRYRKDSSGLSVAIFCFVVGNTAQKRT